MGIDANNKQQTGTMIVKGGQLSQLTTKSYTLSQLNGMQINVPNFSQIGSQTNTNDVIVWNSTSQTFQKVGTQSCSMSDGCTTLIKHLLITLA